MNDQLEPIGVICVGWVGLVTAACFAELGHEVWARDIVPEKVEALSRGELPIHEPGLVMLAHYVVRVPSRSRPLPGAAGDMNTRFAAAPDSH